jgi:acetyl-CoA carboxylase biotin carboxyl carrier protein
MRDSAIKRLIKLVEESQIEELEVSRWGRRVRISKRARTGPAAGSGAVVQAGEASPEPQEEASQPAAGESDDLMAIKSPMVGTFYRASTPTTEPFVKVGQVIEKGTVVCLVEAMKLMNEIESEVSGRIVKILAEDAQPVEFGQVLFQVEPS